MNKVESSIQDHLDLLIDYPTIFRSSENYEDFMEQCGKVGADADEASMMWDELTYKYSH